MNYYNTIIIGAGPAGLAAGLFLKEKKVNFIIFDRGSRYQDRDRSEPFQVSHGVGGSGLFSDGKFSYPPAASGLWQEWNLEKAERIYRQLEDMFGRCGIGLKSWEDVKAGMLLPDSEIKKYDSAVFDFAERKRIMEYMCHELEGFIAANTAIVSVKENDDHIFSVTTDTGERYTGSTVVIATGKKSPLPLMPDYPEEKKHSIYEMGIRVECPQEYYRPLSSESADYKQIIQIDSDTQLRTFCSCKRGSVIQSSYDGIRFTYNGDSSEPRPYSNVGIIIRTTSSASEYAREMQQAYDRKETQCLPLKKYLQGAPVVGGAIDRKILDYLPQIIPIRDENCLSDCRVYGPEIERYGGYPDTDPNQLLTNGQNIYVCGDAAGKYRGLFAAFFSGFCCANAIEAAHMAWIDEKIAQFHIDTSETERMPTVFTAQSKVYFYCRDAICEYALLQGYLPINPFRVFDYFLSDRVDRDMIRRGNNNLLQMCDELWVFGPISNGVLFEIFSAIKQRKHIRFFSIGTRRKDIDELDLEQISFEPEVHKNQIQKKDLISFIRESNYGYFSRPDYDQMSLFDRY